MGTPAERDTRNRSTEQRARVVRWYEGGNYTGPDSLKAFLRSIGANENGPLFKEFAGEGSFEGGGGGLYDVYGPSADPMKEYDLQSGMFRWRIKNQDGSLKYPNWNPIPPVELARIQGFYNWRDSAEGRALAAKHGGSFIAAWYANHGNSQDMSWTGKEWAPQMGSAPGGAADFAGGGGGGTGTAQGKLLSNIADILLAQANADLQGQLSQLRKTLEGERVGGTVLDWMAKQAAEVLGVEFDFGKAPIPSTGPGGGGDGELPGSPDGQPGPVAPPQPAEPVTPGAGGGGGERGVPKPYSANVAALSPINEHTCNLYNGQWINGKCIKDGREIQCNPNTPGCTVGGVPGEPGAPPEGAPTPPFGEDVLDPNIAPECECGKVLHEVGSPCFEKCEALGGGTNPGKAFCEANPNDSRCRNRVTGEPYQGTGNALSVTAFDPGRGTVKDIDREGLDWRNIGNYARYMPEIEAVANTYNPLLQRGANLLPRGGARNRFLESGVMGMAGNITDIWRKRAADARDFLSQYGSSMWSGQPMFTNSAAAANSANTSTNIARMQDETARYGIDKQLSASKWSSLGDIIGKIIPGLF